MLASLWTKEKTAVFSCGVSERLIYVRIEHAHRKRHIHAVGTRSRIPPALCCAIRVRRLVLTVQSREKLGTCAEPHVFCGATGVQRVDEEPEERVPRHRHHQSALQMQTQCGPLSDVRQMSEERRDAPLDGGVDGTNEFVVHIGIDAAELV